MSAPSDDAAEGTIGAESSAPLSPVAPLTPLATPEPAAGPAIPSSSEPQEHSEAPGEGGAASDVETPARDVAALVPSEWERRPVPDSLSGARGAGFQVVVRQSVLNQVHGHGRAARDVEVCGVLAGNVYHDDRGAWLFVQHAIEGNHAAGRSAQVTFTADTWAHIQSVMDRDHPDLRVVGWYHTHPGFGIFLSDMDLFIQDNFFPEPWQVALVYDPAGNEEGLFVWRENKPGPERFLVEEDAPREHATRVVDKARDTSAQALYGAAGGEGGVLAERLAAIEKRQKVTLAVLMLTLLLALFWPLVVALWLPNVLRQTRPTPPAPPMKVPDYNDPTSRPALGL